VLRLGLPSPTKSSLKLPTTSWGIFHQTKWTLRTRRVMTMTTKPRRLIWKSLDLKGRKRIECTLGSIFILYIYIFDAYLFCLDTVCICTLCSSISMCGGKTPGPKTVIRHALTSGINQRYCLNYIEYQLSLRFCGREEEGNLIPLLQPWAG